MIKSINKNNVLITPFVATKGCELSGFQTDDLLLTEDTPASGINPASGSVPIALDFVDYSNGLANPVLNRNCSIALEQQTLDQVIYEEGVSGSGLFYPDSEATNINGSYKRLVWNQIRTSFYNNYRNPTQLFGLENIDIDLSGTKRVFADRVRVFTVPRVIFGEKLLENSIRLKDNALDDEYVISDDGKGNLIAKNNLFSKYQAVRPWGNFIVSGSTGYTCPPVIVEPPTGSFTLTGSLTASISGACQAPPFTASLNWTDPFTNENGFKVWMATQVNTASAWSLYTTVSDVGANVTSSLIMFNDIIISASFYVKAYNAIGTSSATNIVYVNITCSAGP